MVPETTSKIVSSNRIRHETIAKPRKSNFVGTFHSVANKLVIVLVTARMLKLSSGA